MTAYYFTCTESFEENLALLLEMVLTPCYSAGSVEKERGIITQEILMYDDSPESRVAEDLFAQLFEGHPLSRPIAGRVEDVAAITAEQLQLCHEAFYHPANMALCVVGDVDPQAVARIAGARGCPGELPRRHYGPILARGPGRHSRRMELPLPCFCLGWRCPPPAPGEDLLVRELTGELAAELLAGESSALYQRLYEQGLIDAGFSVGYESIRGWSLLSLGGDSEEPLAVCRAVREQAAALCRRGPDREFFDRLLRSALGSRLRALDSFESICYRICAYCLEGAEYFDFPEAFRQLQPERVLQLLEQSIRDPQAALALILPKEE